MKSFYFVIGGAISNLYAVAVARQAYVPEVKTKGMNAQPRLVLFTSEHVSTISNGFASVLTPYDIVESNQIGFE